MIESSSVQKPCSYHWPLQPGLYAPPVRPRITHPSTSKCAVFQAYSNKPAILPLFKTSLLTTTISGRCLAQATGGHEGRRRAYAVDPQGAVPLPYS